MMLMPERSEIIIIIIKSGVLIEIAYDRT